MHTKRGKEYMVIVHPLVANGFHIKKVTVYMLNELSWKAEIGWTFSSGIEAGLTIPHHEEFACYKTVTLNPTRSFAVI
jgi:hypothetical protein